MFVLVGLVLCVLVAASALFSGIEMALFSLHPVQIDRLKARSPRLAAALRELLGNPRRLLSAILLADACVNLPLIVLCLFLMRLPAVLPFWAVALATFAVVVFLCDLLPKLAAIAQPVRVARLGVGVLRWLLPVLDPAARLLQHISERIADALTPASFQPHRPLSEEEMETLVELSAEEGTLGAAETEMIQEIVKLGDKTAKDCMTPRTEAYLLPDDLTNDAAIHDLRTHRYRRVPIYGGTPDDILGVLDVKTFLADPNRHYTEVMSPPSFVSETMQALDLLRSFLGKPQRLAIVVDEFGGTEGVVTLYDIVEEILGDAAPSGDAELLIEHAGEGRLIVNGSARLDELGERLGVDLEKEGLDTIGGLVFNRLGYLPKPGAKLQMEGLEITIRRVSRKRIQELLIVEEQDVPDAQRSTLNPQPPQ